MCVFFKRNCLGLQKFLPMTQSPLVFAARSCGAYLLALEPWAWGPGVQLGLLAPGISLPNFYPPYMGVVPVHSASSPLLPVWMGVVSSIP